ncbi:DUF1983 domain-containing protein [Dyella telluris]|uniref:DUF1983 domain-containing protein n=1 Tax=Dyella telluris TaxID=2763498 RepID=A0A7G8Q4F0_9GAMM|nr:DUF1983 domain-containing protein [Dyella telluris]
MELLRKSSGIGNTVSLGSSISSVDKFDTHIRVIEIRNPLAPEIKEARWEEFREGAVIADFIPDGRFVAGVNGSAVPDELWDSYSLNPGDSVVIVPVMHGGNGGKMALRIIALAVITYFSAGWGASLSTTIMGSSAYAGAFAAGIVIAGSMLVNALIPLPTAKLGGGSDESSTYGLSGPVNTSNEDMPIPVCYGQFRMAGNIIGLHTENQQKTQIVYMLVNAGEGPVAGIEDIRINDQPLDSFKNVQTEIRLGDEDQAVIPWFSTNELATDTGNPEVPVYNADPSTSPLVRFTSGTVDRLRIDMSAPTGLMTVDKKGKTQWANVDLRIAYMRVNADGSPAPGAAWEYTIGTYEIAGYTNKFYYWDKLTFAPDTGLKISNALKAEIAEKLRANSTIDGDDILDSQGNIVGQVIQDPVYTQKSQDGKVTFSSNTRYPTRISYYTPPLKPGYYKVAVCRTNPKLADDKGIDAVNFEAIGEITSASVAYNNTALVAVRVQLSDQLNGLPNITYLNKGRRIRYWDRATKQWMIGASSNPAWVCLDMLLDDRLGADVSADDLDLESFKDWAHYCDTLAPAPLEFNGVIDSASNIWEALKLVSRCGHAQVIRTGTRYTVVIERADEPVMMFSEANIVKDSLKVSWLSTADRANAVEGTFWDRDDDFKKSTIKISDDIAGVPFREVVASIDMIGVTSRQRAMEDLNLQLNMNRLITRTVEFSAAYDSLGCALGSVIVVKHLAQKTVASGRLIADATANHLLLDQDVTVQAGLKQTVLLFAASWEVNQFSSACAVGSYSPAGGWIRVSGFKALKGGLVSPLTAQFLRVRSADGKSYKEMRVNQWEEQDDGTALAWVDPWSTSDVNTSAFVQLVAGDVVVELPVKAPAKTGVQDYVDLDGNFSQLLQSAPIRTHFLFGTLEAVKRLYRVTGINGGPTAETASITALEYNAEVYSTSGLIAPKPPGDGVPLYIGQVENLVASPNVSYDDIKARFYVDVHWERPKTGDYDGAELFRLDPNADEWKSVGKVTAGYTIYSFEAEKDDVFSLRVVAIDRVGNRAPFSKAPTVTVEVKAAITAAVTPLDLNVTTLPFACRLSWAVSDATRVAQTEIYYTLGIDQEPSKSFADATLADTVSAFSFTHTNRGEGQFRYWIRLKDTAGNKGDPFPKDGVIGTAQTSIQQIMEENGEKVSAGMLDKELRTNIDQIPQLFDLLAGSDLNGKVDMTTFVDTIAETWRLLTLADNHQTRISVEENVRQSEDEALAQRITTFYAELNENIAAGIVEERTARAAADEAFAKSMDAMAVRMGQAEAGIASESKARADADSAEATARTTLAAKMADDLAAGISSEKQARVDADGAISSDVGKLATRMGAAETAITNEQKARSDGDSAEATSRNNIIAKIVGKADGSAVTDDSTIGQKVSSSVAAYDKTIQALVKDNYATITSQEQLSLKVTGTKDGATITNSSYLGSLQTSVSDLQNGKFVTEWARQMFADSTSEAGKAQAKITNLESIVFTGSGNLVSQVNQLSYDTYNAGGTVRQAIEQRLSISDFQSQYSLRIDVNGYVAGFGLGVTSKPGAGPTSQFIVRADQFLVGAPGIANVFPFQVITSGDYRGVWMDAAYIRDGTITNAKIGDTIQSWNYDGNNGWQIRKDGTAIFNNAIIRGDLTAGSITGKFQASNIISWSGDITASGGATDAFWLDNPVRSGEWHRPVVMMEVNSYNSGSDPCNGTVTIEKLVGSSWVPMRQVNIYLGSRNSAVNTFLIPDDMINGSRAYRVHTTSGGNRDGNFHVNLVQGYIFGLR